MPPESFQGANHGWGSAFSELRPPTTHNPLRWAPVRSPTQDDAARRRSRLRGAWVSLVVTVLTGVALTPRADGEAAPTDHDGTPPSAVERWPGGSAVVSASVSGQFGTDLSGLAYEPAGAGRPATLWAVRNDPATLFRLERSGSTWVPASAGGWGAGKVVTNPGNSSSPDAEAVALTGAGSAAGVYVASERSNSNKQVSSLTVLRYDVSGSGGVLTATRVWNLTAGLPLVDPNKGFESLTWVPDADLTAAGFVDERTGAAYAPDSYPGHGDGLFLVGVEATGTIYAYALADTGAAYRIATIEPTVAARSLGAGSLMDLQYDADRRRLWATCDNGCQGRSATYEVATSGDRQGRFALSHVYERPAGLPNANNEGFAFAPDAECTAAGTKPAWWADDDQSGGYSIREGTLACVPPVEPTPSEEPTAEPTREPTEAVPTQPTTSAPPTPKPLTTAAHVRVTALAGRRVRVRVNAPGLGRAHLNQRVEVTVTRTPGVRGVRLRYGVATLRLPARATRTGPGDRVRVTVVVRPFTRVADTGVAYDVSGTVARARVTVR